MAATEFPRYTSEQFFHHFKLISILGHGGFGVVFKVQRLDGTFWAVKLMGLDENDSMELPLKQLRTIAKVSTYKDRIPTLGTFFDFCIIDDATKAISNLQDPATNQYIFDCPFCGPERFEITSFMMYTMPLYFPIEWDTLSPNQQGIVYGQLMVTLPLFARYGIWPEDIARSKIEGSKPNLTDINSLDFNWKNMMFVDASRTTIAIIDCDLYEFFPVAN